MIGIIRTPVVRTPNQFGGNHHGVPYGQSVQPFDAIQYPACPGNGCDQTDRLTAIVDRTSAGRMPAGA